MKFIVSLISAFIIIVSFTGQCVAFTFDKWESGISCDEAYRIAVTNGIQLRPSGYRGGPGKALLSREYDDTLMGEPAEIVLFFTPITKKLCRIYVTWNRSSKIQSIQPARLDALFDEVKNILNEKHSNDASTNHRIYQNTFMCGGIKKGQVKEILIRKLDYTIELSQSVPCNWVTVEYKDSVLMQLQDSEIQHGQNDTAADYKKECYRVSIGHGINGTQTCRRKTQD